MVTDNGKEIYDYTLKILFETCKDLDKYSQRLLTIAGSNAILINFATASHSESLWLIGTKIISLVLFCASLLVCLVTILPIDTGNIHAPDDVADNLWGEGKAVFYSTLIKQLSKAIEEIGKTIDYKARRVRIAIVATILGALAFGVNSIIYSFALYIKSHCG